MVLTCVALMTNNVKYVFICLLAICISSFIKCLVKYFYPIFYWVICLFIIKLQEYFIYFGYKSFVKCMYFEHFLLVYVFLVHFLYSVFDKQKLLI